jgi:hypothetical protein
MGKFDFAITRKGDYNLTFNLTQSGTPFDVTDYVLYLTAKTNEDDAQGSAILAVSGVGAGANGASGTIIVPITAEDTGSITPGTLYYDALLKSSAGDYTPVCKGVLTVKRNITDFTL